MVIDNAGKTSMVGERKRLEQAYARLRPACEAALRDTYEHVRTLLTTHGLNANIKLRLKSFDSYFDKMMRVWPERDAATVLDDVLGLRIVCAFLEDVERVERVLREHFQVLEVDRKGRRKNISEFGYDSIHILIALPEGALPEPLPHTRAVCEVQLRTILQDAWAEVEHELIYKADDSPLNETIKRKLASLNASLTLSDIIFQEIRDYQKTIQHRGAERRRSMHEQALPDEPITLLANVNGFNHDDHDEEEQLTLAWPKANGETSEERAEASAPGAAAPKRPGMTPQSEFERLLYAALGFHGNQDFEQAIEIYTTILEMTLPVKVRAVVFNHRGMAWFGLGEYARALDDFSSALECDPNKVQALNNRALAWRMLQEHARALEDIERSLSLNASLMDGYYIRALVGYDLGDFTRALADCDKALNLKPGFAPAQRLRRVLAAHLMK